MSQNRRFLKQNFVTINIKVIARDDESLQDPFKLSDLPQEEAA